MIGRRDADICGAARAETASHLNSRQTSGWFYYIRRGILCISVTYCCDYGKRQLIVGSSDDDAGRYFIVICRTEAGHKISEQCAFFIVT